MMLQLRNKCLYLFTACLLIVACGHSLFTYKGKMTRAENRIALQAGGPHKSVWQTRDLTLDYVYVKQSDHLEITGTVAFDNHLVYGFRTLNHFFLKVYFTDGDGLILDEATLVTAGYNSDIDAIRIQEKLTLPPGAVALVFGYTGRAVEGGSAGADDIAGDGVDWDFWKSPLR